MLKRMGWGELHWMWWNFGPLGQCDQCLRGWAGENCTECDANFGPLGQCDQCLRGWAGENCTECDANFGPLGQCDQCLRGWAGKNCTGCAINFGPAGNCTNCLIGWAGLNCDFCDHGWTGDNCSKCDTNLLANVISVWEHGLERTVASVLQTLDLQDSVICVYLDGLDQSVTIVKDLVSAQRATALNVSRMVPGQDFTSTEIWHII